MLSYPALLAGYRLVHEAMADRRIPAYLHAFLDQDVIPLLAAPPGMTLELSRHGPEPLRQPGASTTSSLRITSDGASKIPVFLGDTLRACSRPAATIAGSPSCWPPSAAIWPAATTAATRSSRGAASDDGRPCRAMRRSRHAVLRIGTSRAWGWSGAVPRERRGTTGPIAAEGVLATLAASQAEGERAIISRSTISRAGSRSSPAAARASALPAPRRWARPGPRGRGRDAAGAGRGAVAELKGLGINAAGMTLDVTKSAQVDEVAARVERELGPAAYPGQQCRGGEERRARRGHQRRALAPPHGRQPGRPVLVLPRLRPADAGGRPRLDREPGLDVGGDRQQAAAPGVLQRVQGRRAPPDQVAGLRVGARVACGSTRSPPPTSRRR